MDFKKIFLLLVLFKQCVGVIYRLNKSEHARMPPLVSLDEYSTCVYAGIKYCFVPVTIIPDGSSPLYDMIWEYSEHYTTHFNHTKIWNFVCLSKTCKKYLQGNETDPSENLAACLGDKFWSEYELNSTIEKDGVKCFDDNESMKIDVSDLAVAIVCIVLLLLNFIGSVYDIYFVKNTKGNKLLMCFSIRSNWKRLIDTRVVEDSRKSRLKGFDGLRTITLLPVVLIHCVVPFAIAIDNTQYFEETYHDVLTLIAANWIILVTQTFFTMSGFLLAYNIQMEKEKGDVKWTSLPRRVINRWLRLTPPYAFMYAITCTWQRYMGSGPMWQNAVMDEVKDCRRDWWLYLLYANNYLEHSMCMPQSWYLASDFHLHLIGLIVCIVFAGNFRKILLVVLFGVGLIAPAAHTYFEDLDAWVVPSPESFRDIFLTDPIVKHVYMPTHTNIVCFVIGLWLGLAVYEWQKREYDFSHFKKYRYIYYAALIVLSVSLSTGGIFYRDAPRFPVYVRAIHSGLQRPVFGVIIGTIILGMVFKLNVLPAVFRDVLEWRGWVVPAKISYCVFIIQFPIIRLSIGIRTTLIHASVLLGIQFFVGVVGMSFALAVPFWLLVEAPIDRLVRIFTSKKAEPKSSATEMKSP